MKTPLRIAPNPFNYDKQLSEEVVAGVAATFSSTIIHFNGNDALTWAIAAIALSVASGQPTLISLNVKCMPVTIVTSHAIEISDALRDLKENCRNRTNNEFAPKLIDCPLGMPPNSLQAQPQSLIIFDRLRPHGFKQLLRCGHALLIFAGIGDRWGYSNRRAFLYGDNTDRLFAFRDNRGEFSHEIAVRPRSRSAR